MKGLVKKVLVTVLSGAILITSMQLPVLLADSTTSSIVDIDEAKKIAFAQVVSDMKVNKEKSWQSVVNLNKITTLYDLDNNPSAYLFELTNEDSQPSGYIIVGADKGYAPIIEYSYSGKVFLNEALEKSKNPKKNRKNSKIYYLKGLNFLVENTYSDGVQNTYDVSTFDESNKNFKEVKKTDFKKISLNDFDKNAYKNDWENLLNIYSSNPPTSGTTPITQTSLANYEKGFTSSRQVNVYRYDSTGYSIVNDFKDPRTACAPTAAVNLFRYWYARDNETFKKLYDSNGWKTTYKTLFGYMGTSRSTGGTNPNNIGYSVYQYCKDKGCPMKDFTTDTSVSWKDVTSEIVDGGRPFIYSIFGHYFYGNHAVLGIGIQEFKYSDGSYSNYIRIVDGFTNTNNRYIHFTKGYSSGSKTPVMTKCVY